MKPEPTVKKTGDKRRNLNSFKGKAGPGRPPGSKNKSTLMGSELARGLLNEPRYLAGLRKRLREGTCPYQVELTLYYYAYGKPKEDPVVVVDQRSTEGPALPVVDARSQLRELIKAMLENKLLPPSIEALKEPITVNGVDNGINGKDPGR